MKPILFNTSMVQAILDGRKTTTRRLFNDLKEFEIRKDGFIQADIENKNGIYYFAGDIQELSKQFSKYKVGDVLYVRETWQLSNPLGDFSKGNRTAQYYYKAGFGTDGIRKTITKDDEKKLGVWRPSIHMPKEAARIFLKVKSVRVERLHDIDDEGALDEGVTKHLRCKLGYTSKNSEEEFNFTQARDTFKLLWNTTVRKKDLHTKGWGANPYVWVIEFERISKYEINE